MEASWRWMALTAVAPIAWGSGYVVTHQVLPPDAALWGSVIRALPAGLLLLAVARRRPHGSWWWRAAVLGVLDVGAFFVLVYLAAQLLPSSLAATLMASSAGVMMLLAWPLLGDRPAPRSLLGAAVGIAGVCLMLLGGVDGVSTGGVLASLGAMTMSSVGFLLTKRWSPDVPVLALASWQLVAGGGLLLPVAVAVEGAPPGLDGSEVLGFAYVTLVATALAYAAWLAGLRRLRAGTVGLIGLLNPVAGVLLGTLVASEALGPRQLAGIALVLGGVLVGRPDASWRLRARRDRAAPAPPDPRAPGPARAARRPRSAGPSGRPPSPAAPRPDSS